MNSMKKDEETKTQGFKYFFCGIKLTLSEDFIEWRQRNWYLIGVDKKKFLWQNIAGVHADRHLIGADIMIESVGSSSIVGYGFSKKQAKKFTSLASNYISQNSQKSRDQNLSTSIANSIKNNDSKVGSVADELVKLQQLFKEGIITEKEFETQKNKVLNS